MFFVKVIKKRSVLCINYFQIIKIFKSTEWTEEKGQKEKQNIEQKTKDRVSQMFLLKWLIEQRSVLCINYFQIILSYPLKYG